MASDSRARERRHPDDGVRITRTRRRSPAPVVLGCLGLVLGAWLGTRALRQERSAVDPEPPPVPRGGSRGADTAAPVAATRPPEAAPQASALVPRDPERAARMRQRREERQLERRERSEPRYTLNAPGEQGGMAAFPPPGTKPIKRGIVVPDGVELPEGYVRHYQTTDDGRPLPPVLMFHPDALGVDENGNPRLAPEDRVVPPDLAPPGLAQRTLDPATDVDGRVGRPQHSDPGRPNGRR